MLRAGRTGAAIVLAAAIAGPARAEPPAKGLRDRLGADDAARLMRSSDPDDRLRGVEQAARLRTPGGLALLERAAGTQEVHDLDPRMPAAGVARTDPRALLAVVRGLAGWARQGDARAALAEIVSTPGGSLAPRAADRGGADGAARVLLARREAAIALAGSGSAIATEALVAIARGEGPGRAAALDALAIYPPAAPVALDGAALTTPATIALAVRVGDLRALDAILGDAAAGDPALRAAAIEALGDGGDARGLEIARAGLRDGDARVRLAAARALVRLGAPDAHEAVAALVGDDATAIEALGLARDVQGDDVTRAAAARAAAASDAAVREAALDALGRQASAPAVQALSAFVADPVLDGDAAVAIARSPSPAAMDAIEALAGAGGAASRRLAARAYLVRRYTRGETSDRLDALLRSLAASADGRDRAIGVEALIALGERGLSAALADRDARVRRAGVLGAMGSGEAGACERMLDRIAAEPDGATRRLLAFGWSRARADRPSPSTSSLIDEAGAGGPDAPLAAMGLARRDDPVARGPVDALLGSADPVMRAHAARGLGESRAPDALERLSRAYLWEADASVRRAVVAALAARADAPPGARARTLDLAARLDPDPLARWTARRGLRGLAPPPAAPAREVLWVHLAPAEGARIPQDVEATLIRSDGLAVPVAFDDDGYALVPGVPPGEGRVRLAPRDDAYSPPRP